MEHNYYYDGPGGEARFYHVRAVEVPGGLFNVYARNIVAGYSANGVFGTVAQAEDWVASDRHRLAVGDTRICDWHGCLRVAGFHVRCDLPRGESFTSLMWWRCGDHAPEATDRVHVLPYSGGDEA